MLALRIRNVIAKRRSIRFIQNGKTQQKPVAIVTGSSSGIGQGIAEELARTGYAVTIHGRNRSGLGSTANKCLSAGCEEQDILSVDGDLLQNEVLQDIPLRTLEKFGRIDVLINNAGEGFVPDKMSVLDPARFDRIMGVNIRAPVILTKYSLDALKASRGSVLNISSVAVDNCKLMIYGISKVGLEHFTRSLALELAHFGIRVNCIKPGAIMTSVWERFGSLSDEGKKKLTDTLTNYFHPLRRLTSQADINNAVTFILSQKSSFITGAVIPVTGGAHLPYDGRLRKLQEEALKVHGVYF